MKKTGTVLLWIIGIFLVLRAAVEPFAIDLHDPAAYHLDWGGPHLAGVLAIHMGPGIIALALMIRALTHRRPVASQRGDGPPNDQLDAASH